MHKIHSTLLTVAIAVLVLATVTAQAQTEITVWTFGNLAFSEEMLAEFEKKTGIRVNNEIRPWGDRTEGLSVAIAAGVPPDAVYLNDDFVPIFQGIGLLEPLERHIPKDFLGDYPEGYVNSLRDKTGGQLYQWPIIELPRLGMINADMFLESGVDADSPPVHWDDIATVARKFVRFGSDGALERTGIQMSQNERTTAQGYQWVMYQFGAEFFSEDRTRVAFDSPEGIEALEFLIDLKEQEIIAPLSWTSGDAGMFYTTGTAPVNRITGESSVEFNWRWAPVSEFDRRITVSSNAGFVLPHNAGNKEAAIEFLTFITERENHLSILRQWGTMSLRRSIAPSDYGPATEGWVAQMLEEAAPYFELRGWQDERTINQQYLSPHVMRAWNGELPARTALEQAAELANSYIAEEMARRKQ